jgi:hypothetical protein
VEKQPAALSVADLKKEVDALLSGKLAGLSAGIVMREAAERDAQINRDFSEGGHLCDLLAEVRDDIRAGRL